MRAIKLLLIVFIASIGITLLASRSDTTASPTSPTQKTTHELHNESVQAAIAACEIVTRRTSKLAVGEITDEYELTGATKPGHYRVGFDYRAKGAGLLMAANCEYEDAGDGKLALVRQISAIK